MPSPKLPHYLHEVPVKDKPKHQCGVTQFKCRRKVKYQYVGQDTKRHGLYYCCCDHLPEIVGGLVIAALSALAGWEIGFALADTVLP